MNNEMEINIKLIEENMDFIHKIKEKNLNN